MGVVKPLVLVQKGEFREGLKRNWTVSLEMGVVVVGAKAVQRPTQGQSPSKRLLGEELVLEYKLYGLRSAVLGHSWARECTLHT